MRKHTVSIIVSDLETHPALPRLLQSISRQSDGLDRTEIVIAGNGGHASSDLGIWRAITGLEAIRLEEFDADVTPARARNQAASRALGDRLMFVRPDYRLDPKYLTTADAVFEDHPETGIMYADYIRLAPAKNRSLGPSMVQLPSYRDGLLQVRGFLGPGVLITREAFDRTGGFRDNTFYRDWDLWVQAALSGTRFHHVAYPLASCEHHKASFKERAEDGRCKAILVINNQQFFHEHTVRWALAYLRGDAWAAAFGFMSIPGPLDVTHMLHDHAMRAMGTDALADEAIRRFRHAAINSGPF
ncbi:glycosyltransferase family 2 protein [Pseudodesulfovibrio thermohalotolerans]|uniref:glycosyltransferase family 2 protein n=1 Tax=Pseudodesulfovibrio thermohalotolerans TaxID=2880651 RepID=UPI00244242D3|nr:glycosyltransferase family 2 protein [Pseudodesulfovibrio thermohalotolerans]WFS61151.1 glycosyltransferase family 2 protein [Pseudodesulfovibrio thermohalotolerans]